MQVRQRHPKLAITFLSVDPKGYAVGSSDVTMTTTIRLASASRPAHPDVILVQTHKDIGQVAGTFLIRLVARRDVQKRTWAQIIQPGDYVEIRMSNDYVDRASDETLIMRGFVDSTREVKGVGSDGAPETYVEIVGRDYGKLLLRAFFFLGPSVNKWGVYYGQHAAMLAPELTLFQGQFVNISPRQFIRAIMQAVLGQTGQATGQGIVMPIPKGAPPLQWAVDTALDPYRIVNVTEGPLTGSIWNLFSYYASQPFCELFVTDDTLRSGEGPPQAGEQGFAPRLIWRWSPYRGPDGKLAWPEANLLFPDVPDVSLADVERMDVARSDEQAYTYFIGYPHIQNDQDEAMWQLYCAPQPDGTAVWDAALTQRFGFLPLEARLMFVPQGLDIVGSATETQVKDAQQSVGQPLAKRLSTWLWRVFHRNYLYENGTITIKGNPACRIGRYLTLKETGQRFYIEAVDHFFSVDPLHFSTTLTVTRGEWTRGSPYPVVYSQQAQGHPLLAPIQFSASANPVNAQPTSAPAPGTCGQWTYPTAHAPITQCFGMTAFARTGYYGGAGHSGIDIGVPDGTPVYAVADATVVEVRDTGSDASSRSGGFGNYVKIKLTNKDCPVTVLYGHLSTGSIKVKVGDKVKAGQVLGLSGHSGNAEGPHLHFEVDAPGPVDPSQYLGFVCKEGATP